MSCKQIICDDSSAYTGASPYPTHAYTFDPHWLNSVYTYGYNTRPYTLTASEDGQTITTGGNIYVYAGGAGDLTVGGSTTATEGQPVTLSASFSDSNFVGYVTANADWETVFDETNSNSAWDATYGTLQDVVTYAYPLAGTYTIQWDVAYTDTNYGGANQVFYKQATQQVVVQHATPTVSISGPGTANVGQNYTYTPQFTAAAGSDETAAQWTINWGDGHSSNVGVPSAYHHDYATPGTYTIDATATTNEGTYTTSYDVSAVGPTVGITDLHGAAYEGGAADYFIVTRSFADSLPLNVSFTIGGDATSGEYELTDSSGDILTNSVTIPANVTFADVIVTALDDPTPYWSDTLSISLGASTAYTISSSHPSAVSNLVDGNVGITLGNGSGDMILDGSDDGTQNLVPLVLSFPEETNNGAVLTLKDSEDTEADVWTTPDPGSGDQPILGDVDGVYTSSMTWTYGTDTLPDTTLWVGGTDGSANMNDIDFTLTASDADADDPPAYPTTKPAASQPASNVWIQIKSYNNPNDPNTPPTVDVTGDTARPWLVGQMVDLVATVNGPAALTKFAQIAWDTPGGNVLRYWSATTPSSKSIPISNDDGGGAGAPGPAVQTGLLEPRLDFFWVSTPATPGSYTPYQVTARWPFESDESGDYATASVTFNVYTPSDNVQQNWKQGLAGIWINQANNRQILGMGPNFAQGIGYGVSWDASVTTPQPPSGGSFSQGEFKYLQIAKPSTGSMRAKNGVWQYANLAGAWSLDGKDYVPAATEMDTNGHITAITPFNAPGGANAWLTDSHDGLSGDTPGSAIDIQGLTDEQRSDEFNTFLMYLAPGSNSQWVPLEVQDWSYLVAASFKVGQWIPSNSWQQINNFSRATQEPSWSNVANRNNYWNQ